MLKENGARSIPSPETPKPKSARARLEEMRLQREKMRQIEEIDPALIEEESEEPEGFEVDLHELQETTGKVPITRAEKLMRIQQERVIPSFEVSGFKGLRVAATIEVKPDRKMGERNEDVFIVDPETGLMGVADGLGGEKNAAEASIMAERQLAGHFKEQMERIQNLDKNMVIQKLAESSLAREKQESTEDMLAKKARGEKNDQELAVQQMKTIMEIDPRLGRKTLALIEAIKATNKDVQTVEGQTTICAGFIHETPGGEHHAVVANLGDSGAFIRHKNGEIIELTDEDSLLAVLLSSGTISTDYLAKMKADPKQKFPIPLTLDIVLASKGGTEKMYEDLKNQGIPSVQLSYEKIKKTMAKALGMPEAEPKFTIRPLKKGDEVLFSTDGMIDFFENTEEEKLDRRALEATLAGDADNRLDKLRTLAKQRSTEDRYKHKKGGDDIAMVLAQVL